VVASTAVRVLADGWRDPQGRTRPFICLITGLGADESGSASLERCRAPTSESYAYDRQGPPPPTPRAAGPRTQTNATGRLPRPAGPAHASPWRRLPRHGNGNHDDHPGGGPGDEVPRTQRAQGLKHRDQLVPAVLGGHCQPHAGPGELHRPGLDHQGREHWPGRAPSPLRTPRAAPARPRPPA